MTNNKRRAKGKSTLIVIGTKNGHKVREILSIWRLHQKKKDLYLPLVHKSLRDRAGVIKFIPLDRLPQTSVVTENGWTYLANAIRKAVVWAKETGHITLAEDSGLEVKALKDQPGIYSARYAFAEMRPPWRAGKKDINVENNRKVIDKLDNAGSRKACYRCYAVLASSQGKIIYRAKGLCQGRIALKPAGKNGFGYDPIFIPAEKNPKQQTFGQLSLKIKYQISHRAKAMHKIFAFLRRQVRLNGEAVN